LKRRVPVLVRAGEARGRVADRNGRHATCKGVENWVLKNELLSGL